MIKVLKKIFGCLLAIIACLLLVGGCVQLIEFKYAINAFSGLFCLLLGGSIGQLSAMLLFDSYADAVEKNDKLFIEKTRLN